jgi:dienelactone hydrolase
MAVRSLTMNAQQQSTLTRDFVKCGLVFSISLSWMIHGSKPSPLAAVDEPDRGLAPFLEVFQANQQPPVVTQVITIPSPGGDVSGLVARPDSKERLPAVILIPGKEGLTEWTKGNTHDLAGIGYVVLALNLQTKQLQPAMPAPIETENVSDEQTLASLSACVRWLRRRPDVLRYRIGVVGWGWGGSQALNLAASVPVQACVICDGQPICDAACLAGLRHTAVLGIFAGQERIASKSIPAFERALAEKGIVHRIKTYEGVGARFMGPSSQPSYSHLAADRAFVEIYEFLGKYVEDAPEKLIQASSGIPDANNSLLTIADIMLAVNAPEGVRGNLMKALETEPATQSQWDRIRANAAIIGEAGNLLQNRRPPKGKQADWQDQTKAFREVADQIVSAAEQRNIAGARRGLKDLANRCTSCHEMHR